jgi:hypothetical protein
MAVLGSSPSMAKVHQRQRSIIKPDSIGSDPGSLVFEVSDI